MSRRNCSRKVVGDAKPTSRPIQALQALAATGPRLTWRQSVTG